MREHDIIVDQKVRENLKSTTVLVYNIIKLGTCMLHSYLKFNLAT